MPNWFICQNETVRGPFTTEDIKTQLNSGILELDATIWARGQTEWSSVASWSKQSHTETDTAQKGKQEQLWHYAMQGQSKGPMPRAQLINEIRSIQHKDEILVWTKGMKSWVDLFEFHDLIDEIGLNKREHPRAVIAGQAVLKTEDGHTIIAQLKTVSAGGAGVDQIFESLSIGQTITLEIRSPALGEAITTKAAVQYVTDASFVGLKFSSLSMENKARILQYVRGNNQAANAA
jgi:hypothetical protein